MRDKLLDALKMVPQWFAALAAILYATGFLTVFTFMDHMGVRETGAEFSKIKYFHVGILCLFLPFGVIVPFALLASLKKRSAFLAQQKQEAITREQTTGVPGIPVALIPPIGGSIFFLTLNLLWIFYVLICFAPPNFLEETGREWVVPVIFIVTFGSGYLINTMEQKYLKIERAAHFSTNARLIFVGVLVVLD